MDYTTAFQAVIADPRYQRNLDWGESRPGHPEGTVRAHIAEIEPNLVLLAAGADPATYAGDGSGPLHWAASNGHMDVVRTLLDRGSDPNALRDSGQSVLAAAISNGHAAIVETLVQAGGSVDHRYFDRSMSEYAEWQKQDLIAQYLRTWQSRHRRSTHHRNQSE